MIDAPAPMRILRLDHVVLRVQDLARAEAFYARLLGAAVERRIDKPIVLVQLRIGESLLDLVPGRVPVPGDDGAADEDAVVALPAAHSLAPPSAAPRSTTTRKPSDKPVTASSYMSSAWAPGCT